VRCRSTAALIAFVVRAAVTAVALALALVARASRWPFLVFATLVAALIFEFFVAASDQLIALPEIGFGALGFRHLVLFAALVLALAGLALVLTLFGFHDVLLRGRRDCRSLLIEQWACPDDDGAAVAPGESGEVWIGGTTPRRERMAAERR
jgi:hypothetical protein